MSHNTIIDLRDVSYVTVGNKNVLIKVNIYIFCDLSALFFRQNNQNLLHYGRLGMACVHIWAEKSILIAFS